MEHGKTLHQRWPTARSHRTRWRLIGIFGAMAMLPVLWSQNSTPEFDAVSIKRSRDDVAYSARFDAKRWIATAFTAKLLLRTAFFKDGYQITGDPSWTNSERFDIEATTDAPIVPALFPAMLRAMMADRFKLSTHIENRELPGMALTVAKGGPKFSERLARSTPDECQAAAQKAKEENRPGPQCGGVRNAFTGGQSQLLTYAVPISQFCRALSNALQMPVWDDTGLAGTFDITLEWAPDSTANPGGNVNDPSIYAALQEQLGLKPEAARRKTEVVVIDHIERPSPN